MQLFDQYNITWSPGAINPGLFWPIHSQANKETFAWYGLQRVFLFNSIIEAKVFRMGIFSNTLKYKNSRRFIIDNL